MGKKNIVIVGGGDAGVHAAWLLSRSLDPAKYELIMINPLPYRVWLVATLRLAVSPQEGLKEQIMLPYVKVFGKGNGRLVEGIVTSMEASKEGGGSVTLESGEKIEYHVLLLAQGSTWSGPPALPHTDSQVQEHFNTLRTQFAKAQNIFIVGGGAVGYELAGEIKDIWPNKKVTIVHGGDRLLNNAYSDKFRVRAEVALRARGVALVLNDYIDFEGTQEVEGITTRAGKEFKDADFVVQARGPRANTAFVRSALGDQALSDTGCILVRPTLQLKSYDDIFAAGDVIEWKEQKQAAKASGHGTLVGNNILAFLNARKLKDYKGVTEMMVLTNGKNSGFFYIGVLWGLIFGPWLAKPLKSKGLLISLFKSEQGY